MGNAVTLNISVKEKEDAHADPEIQPMKEDDGTFGEYRWALVPSGPASPAPLGTALRHSLSSESRIEWLAGPAWQLLI